MESAKAIAISACTRRALEVGRVSFEDALAFAQERESFGKPIALARTLSNLKCLPAS
ncbi:hypothetical protein [Streptomyces sp. HUAS ZL42]|uniref:hypothetical protein n=1 Tax=Streptomyces sp. HUAS ZL42 TaxID=3231715 RepID=UPI00345E8F36